MSFSVIFPLQEFTSPHYLANWVQSLFNALGGEVEGKVLGLGGDGRYFGKEAAQQIIKLAAGEQMTFVQLWFCAQSFLRIGCLQRC